MTGLNHRNGAGDTLECLIGSRADECHIDVLIGQLKQLHTGANEIAALIECGVAAIPALKRVLYERDPSGIFEPRCRAVTVLAALKARTALLEFIDSPHEDKDPVVRLGEEAVLNRTARALIGWNSPRFYESLKRIARTHPIPGIIEALASFQFAETIPILINALEEDSCRPAAVDGLRKIGGPAREILIDSALSKRPSINRESDSSLRRRRSALQLLCEIRLEQNQRLRLRALTDENDPAIAFLACKITLTGDERTAILQRLILLLDRSDWALAREIEDCLVEYDREARALIDKMLGGESHVGDNNRRRWRTLHKVITRAQDKAKSK